MAALNCCLHDHYSLLVKAFVLRLKGPDCSVSPESACQFLPALSHRFEYACLIDRRSNVATCDFLLSGNQAEAGKKVHSCHDEMKRAKSCPEDYRDSKHT